MAVTHIYKITKGYETVVLSKLFENSKLANCTKVGDCAGTMSAREFRSLGKPYAKILEFKKATYIKSEGELRNSNLAKVRNIGD